MKRLRRIVLLTVLLATCGGLCFSLYDFYHVRDYTPAAIPPFTQTGAASEQNLVPRLSAALEENTQITQEKPPYSKNKVGWLTVSGLEVDEPVMQGTDNSYYLTHNAYDKYSVYGACFALDTCNLQSADTLNRVTVLFGHSAGNSEKDGFARLKKLKNAKIAAENRVISLQLADGAFTQWEIFAAGEYPIAQDYLIAEPSDEYFTWELGEFQAHSFNKYESAEIDTEDKILILSTCTGDSNARYIVCARLINN